MFSALSELDYIFKYRNMSADQYGNTPQTRNRTYIVAFLDQEICDAFRFPDPIERTTDIFDIVNVHIKQKEVYYYSSNDPYYPTIVQSVKRNDSIYRVHDSGIHLAKNRTCPTLTASMGTRDNYVPLLIDDYGYRKLTVQECLDFQGFPKEFMFPKGTSIMEAYKQIGNSVVVPVIRRIAESIRTVI